MGAKSYLFIILVALTVGFALIPTAQAENSIEITSMQHDNARIENSIDLEITNEADEEVSYSLLINVFSEDLHFLEFFRTAFLHCFVHAIGEFHDFRLRVRMPA